MDATAQPDATDRPDATADDHSGAAAAMAAAARSLGRSRNHRERLYRELHAAPELGLREFATAERIRAELTALGLEPLPVGGTGTAVVLANGPGPVVAVRADIDALPVREATGLPYASTAVATDDDGREVPVAHACGHDVHMVALLGALRVAVDCREHWSGTLVGLFQPAEEIAAGARAMLDDGLTELVPTPDVVLAQHVVSGPPDFAVGTRPGPIFSASERVRVVLHGHGTHGSMAHLGVDPVVLAASIVLRLQTLVSREVPSSEQASLTVGSLHAGTRANIVPDSAELLIDTRAYSDEVLAQLRAGIERIVRAECAASACPREPEIRRYETYPVTENDPVATERVLAAFRAHYPGPCVDVPRLPASEDFPHLPAAFGAPSCYWVLGGFADSSSVVGNHDPAFAPDPQPTLDRGAQAIWAAATAWLAP